MTWICLGRALRVMWGKQYGNTPDPNVVWTVEAIQPNTRMTNTINGWETISVTLQLKREIPKS